MLGLSEILITLRQPRYILVVNIGWAILLGSLFAKIWPRFGARRARASGVGDLIPTLGIASYRQTFVWRTDVSLFQGILARLPQRSPDTHQYFHGTGRCVLGTG